MLKIFENKPSAVGAWHGLEAWSAAEPQTYPVADPEPPFSLELERDVETERDVEPEPTPTAVEPAAAPEQHEAKSRHVAAKPKSAAQATAPQTIVFCGAAGGVGRSSVSINVAYELAAAGKSVALVDFDVENPNLLAALNQEAITSGLAGVKRLVGQGRFSGDDLGRLMMVLNFDGVRISVLPGMQAKSDGAQLVPVATELVDALRHEFDHIVIDLPPGQSELGDACLALADASFAVCAGDPIGVQRFLWLKNHLDSLGLEREPHVLVNRVRDSVLGANAKRQLADTIVRLAGTDVTAFVPDDPAAFDLCLREGLPLQLGKKASPARHAVAMFVRQGLLSQRSQLDWRVARNG